MSRSLLHSQSRNAAPSVLLLDPSPLRHAIGIHLIGISTAFLTSSITITATCALAVVSFVVVSLGLTMSLAITGAADSETGEGM
jgi:hypothetical protein